MAERLETHAAGTRCWVLDDGRPGHTGQSLALAQALGRSPAQTPVQTLTGAPCLLDLKTAADAGLPEPGLIIACGRRAAEASRRIRRPRPGLWTAIQILDPREHRQAFDWLIVPRHDRISAPHIIRIDGALNAVSDAYLSDAGDRYRELRDLPCPRRSLLLGGPGRYCRWRKTELAGWLGRLCDRTRQDRGSLLIAWSRRTPDWAVEACRALNLPNKLLVGWKPSQNAYPGVLAYADRLYVTADSVNLVSEACACRAPVSVLGRAMASGKLRRFLDAVERAGYLSDAADRPRLRETERVAEALIRRGALLASAI